MTRLLLFFGLFSILLSGLSAQDLSDQRVERFRTDADELPALLEDLGIDIELDLDLSQGDEIELIRIQQTPPREALFLHGMTQPDFFAHRSESDARDHMRLRLRKDDQVIEWDGEGDAPFELEEFLEKIDGDLEDMDIDMEILMDELEDEIGEIEISVERFSDDCHSLEDTDNTGFLGVYHDTHSLGVLVTDVVPDAPAIGAGMRGGDIIVQIEDQPIRTSGDLTTVLGDYTVGDRISLRYLRGGEERSASLTLAQRPQDSRSNKRFMKRYLRDEYLDEKIGKRKNHKRNFPFFENSWGPRLGVVLSGTEGTTVTEIRESSNALDMGFQAGDQIIQIDGKTVHGSDDIIELVKAKEVGDQITVTVDRQTEDQTDRVELSGTMKASTLNERWQHPVPHHSFPRRMNTSPPVDKEIIIIRPRKDDIDGDLSNDIRRVESIDVYPNPTDGEIRVKYQGSDDPATIRISDQSGRIIMERTIIPSAGRIDENILLGNDMPGVLFLSILQGDEIITERVVTQ